MQSRGSGSLLCFASQRRMRFFGIAKAEAKNSRTPIDSSDTNRNLSDQPCKRLTENKHGLRKLINVKPPETLARFGAVFFME
jgi:hypothetical protein